MSNGCFVGFDTSNYMTSVGVVSEDGKMLLNLKELLPVAAGERGLRQSDALFAHTKNLPALLGTLNAYLRENTLRVLGVGVSATPRQQEGSYMPCFLAGISTAEAFAAGASVSQVQTFDHQQGHVRAAIYSSGAEKLLTEPFYAFHVSGGTTDILSVTPTAEKLYVEIVGGSADLHAGQVIDRVGVMLGFPFPAGPYLEKAAAECVGVVPKKKISVDGTTCHLSGLENLAKKLYEESGDVSLVAAFTFDYVGRTLCKLTENLLAERGKKPVLFAGGVMSNQLMRGKLSAVSEAYFAEPMLSGDNAVGIALLTRDRLTRSGELSCRNI